MHDYHVERIRENPGEVWEKPDYVWQLTEGRWPAKIEHENRRFPDIILMYGDLGDIDSLYTVSVEVKTMVNEKLFARARDQLSGGKEFSESVLGVPCKRGCIAVFDEKVVKALSLLWNNGGKYAWNNGGKYAFKKFYF